ncbi:hypothetical protein OYT00_06735 [Microbacterium paraoxydans]|uniref:AbiTii domain-containing protein n=1 Tax=Microbacterium paraoxydans TaxID=199592 RepID=UPI0022863D20|nr:hypothetical protein [Microbacterium paraoxydans]MCZ0709686.1 hypothetical protein [Microbacterium paraoxydans]
MTILDDIIEASTDTSVATADLLRKVQVVAHRLGAKEVVAWVKSELGGYEEDAELPSYRIMNTSVMGVFTGPMQSTIRQLLTVPAPGMEDLWIAEFRVPLTELQALSELQKDPQREWPSMAVQAYEASGVFSIGFHGLFSAHNIITRQSLRGLIDIVRSKAMEFALELQTDYPEAGTPGGPTVATEPGLSTTVFHVTNNIYGDGTNIATGSDIKQRSRVQKGDLDALQREAESSGLSAEDATKFVAAVTSEKSLEGTRTKRFIDNVRSGAIALSGGIASDVAASGLIEIASSFLGV